MMIITHKIKMDLLEPGQMPRINAVQDDQYSRNLEFSLYEGEKAWIIPSGITVIIRYRKPDGTGGEYNVLPDGSTAWQTEGNLLTVALAPQVATVPGLVSLSAVLVSGEKQVSTFRVSLNVKPAVKGVLEESRDYFRLMTLGTVETLPAGAVATASLSEGVDAPVLNLGIPSGRTPVKGEDYGTEADKEEYRAWLKAVQYTHQTLTEEQMEQARENIGAMSEADVQVLLERQGQTTKEITVEEKSGGFWNKSEEWVSGSGISAKRTNVIPVTEGERFVYTGNGQEAIPSVIWFDENQVQISFEQYAANDAIQLITVPAGAAYARFYSYLYSDVSLVQLEVVFLPESKNRIIVIESRADGYWNGNGVWVDQPGYGARRTNFLQVSQADTFYYTGMALWGIPSVIWYDAAGNYLSMAEYSENDGATSVTIVPPAQAALARFYSFNAGGLDNCVLIVSFETDDKTISWLAGSNYLWGKKYVACGDSFTAGDFGERTAETWDETMQTNKTYPWWIASRNRMTLVNEAISGTTMHNNGDSGAFSLTRYTKIPADADYITLCFGLNETTATIGTLSDSENTTVMGAWNVVLEYLITNHPYAKIGIIIPDAWCSQAMRDALVSVAEYWGIPYLDLKGDKTVPLMIGGRYSNVSVSEKAVALRNAAFQMSDTDSHPNPKAHAYRSTVIENFLRSL